MRHLGIDYGGRQIGIAVSNQEGTIAFPRVIIENDERALQRIAALVEEEGIETIIMGDTRAFSGAENDITPEAEAFARQLAGRVSIDVQFASEAWSSREAARFAPKGVKNDAAEAAVILQRFLDMKKTG